MLRKAIMKTDAFKEFVSQYKERMDAFCSGYYRAVRIDYQFTLEFKFAYHHCDWEDNKKEETYKRCFEFDDTIITNYDFQDKPSDVLAKMITRHVLDTLALKDIERYHVIDGIKADSPWWHINGLWAWSSENVGVYHEEQECGEGWFIMPKEPEVCMRNYINIYE